MNTEQPTTEATPTDLPVPDQALRRLDPLVGTWDARGRFIGADEDNITGRMTFTWLEGGFFLQQDVELDLAGIAQVRSRELIGYDAETGAFTSHAYSNMAPVPLPYRWDMRGSNLTISVSFEPLDATFEGALSEDGNSFSGGWRPNPGADETVNTPYDIAGTRIS